MIRSIKHLARATAMAAVLVSAGAQAAPVTFNVSASGWSVGSGYGNGSSLLGASFGTTSTARTFTLSAGQTSSSFTFGGITLNEDEISAAETDNIGVSATFNFDAPMNANQSITATGVAAFTGDVDDKRVDYSIDWTPLTVTLASGISFIISMADMSFTNNGTQNQTYTISLISEASSTSGGGTVPEPGSLALAGAALALLGASRRRRAR